MTTNTEKATMGVARPLCIGCGKPMLSDEDRACNYCLSIADRVYPGAKFVPESIETHAGMLHQVSEFYELGVDSMAANANFYEGSLLVCRRFLNYAAHHGLRLVDYRVEKISHDGAFYCAAVAVFAGMRPETALKEVTYDADIKSKVLCDMLLDALANGEVQKSFFPPLPSLKDD